MNTNLAVKSGDAVVETSALKGALDKLKLVTEKRAFAPILQHALLTSDKDRMFLTASNLDMEVTVSIPATVEPGMLTTVPTHLLADLVKTAPKGSLTTLTPADDKLLVGFGGPAMELHSLSAVDFPTDGIRVVDTKQYHVSGQTFWDCLDGTMLGISTEETRYYLNGVFLHQLQDTGEVLAVATDGHRLFKQSLGYPDLILSQGMIIPRHAVAVLHKLLKGKACPTSMSFEVPRAANSLRWQWDNVTFTSKMVDGTFPDYPRVIPQSHSLTMVADALTLINAVTQVSAMSSERSKAVKLTLTGGNKLQLGVRNPDQGTATVNLVVQYEWVEQPEANQDHFEIGVNAKYLLDALKTAGKGDVTFLFQDSSSPLRIMSQRTEWVSVLMPMRV